MPSLDGFQRPSLDSIKQASTGALDKAKLMVGLNKGESGEDVESQQSENSGILDEVGEILCPELTFQQVRRTCILRQTEKTSSKIRGGASVPLIFICYAPRSSKPSVSSKIDHFSQLFFVDSKL